MNKQNRAIKRILEAKKRKLFKISKFIEQWLKRRKIKSFLPKRNYCFMTTGRVVYFDSHCAIGGGTAARLIGCNGCLVVENGETKNASRCTNRPNENSEKMVGQALILPCKKIFNEYSKNLYYLTAINGELLSGAETQETQDMPSPFFINYSITDTPSIFLSFTP